MPCTGCNLDYAHAVSAPTRVYSSSYGAVNNSIGPYGYVPSFVTRIDMVGDGLGSLTGITGYSLGTLNMYVERRYSGLCQTVTGVQITGLYSGNPMYENDFTGNIGYSYRTGCDQRNPCKVGKLWFSFSGNPDLYIGAPSARTSIYAWVSSATNGLPPALDFGVLSSGNSYLPSGSLSMTNVRIDCGNRYDALIEAQTLIPGYTGSIRSQCYFTLYCKECSN
jgi:hypothetical protein